MLITWYKQTGKRSDNIINSISPKRKAVFKKRVNDGYQWLKDNINDIDLPDNLDVDEIYNFIKKTYPDIW